MHRPLTPTRKPYLLARLMSVRRGLPRVRCAIVHPCDPGSVEGAERAADAGLIDPVLVGPRPKMRCPIALTSRAGPVESRLASAALLALVSARRQEMAAVTA